MRMNSKASTTTLAKKSSHNIRFANADGKEKASKKGLDECQAFHVLRERYENFKKIGSGAYGVVCSAAELRKSGKVSKQRVAIKRVHPWADDEWDARHTLRELRLMRLLCGHPNIVTLLDAVLCPDGSNDLFIVMELMESDLHQIIGSKQVLTPAHVSCLTVQLLLGIQAMHSVGVLHRDLKPGNLLVSSGCRLRITDFGLSRYIGLGDDDLFAYHCSPRHQQRKDRHSTNHTTRSDSGSEHKKSSPSDEDDASDDSAVKKTPKNPLTEYVVTRWYRCPEVLLAPHLPYTTAVDCWSAGCIVAELIRRKPIFQGKNFVHQVQVILERLGTPASSELGFEPRDDAAKFLARQPHHEAPGLLSLMPKATPSQLKFIESLLRINPKKRATVDQALADPYFDDAPELPGRSKLFFLAQSPEGEHADPAACSFSRAARKFRDNVLDDEGFQFGFENPSATIADLRDAIETDVARVAFARERRLRLLDVAEAAVEDVHPHRRRSSAEVLVRHASDGHEERPYRRRSVPVTSDEEAVKVHRSPSDSSLANDVANSDGSCTADRRPSRTRLFSLPLLRSSKKKNRVRPSLSPITPSALSDDCDAKRQASRKHLHLDQQRNSSIFTRFRTVSAR